LRVWSRFFRRRRRYTKYISSTDASQYRYATHHTHTHTHTHIVVVREKIMTMCGRDYGTIFVHCLAKRFCRRCAFLGDRRRGYIIRSAHVYIFIILIRKVYYIIIILLFYDTKLNPIIFIILISYDIYTFCRRMVV